MLLLSVSVAVAVHPVERSSTFTENSIVLPLAGSAMEIDQFVAQVIKTHHSTDNDDRQGQVSGFQNGGHYLT
jgi:hypothetical protein